MGPWILQTASQAIPLPATSPWIQSASISFPQAFSMPWLGPSGTTTLGRMAHPLINWETPTLLRKAAHLSPATLGGEEGNPGIPIPRDGALLSLLEAQKKGERQVEGLGKDGPRKRGVPAQFVSLGGLRGLKPMCSLGFPGCSHQHLSPYHQECDMSCLILETKHHHLWVLPPNLPRKSGAQEGRQELPLPSTILVRLCAPEEGGHPLSRYTGDPTLTGGGLLCPLKGQRWVWGR